MFGLKQATETSEHTTSHYASTANWQTDYPQLQADIDADVVVVGGGFTGVNTAVELAERGVAVVLLEANRISWGASGRNGGQLIGGIGHGADRFRKQIGEEGIKSINSMGLEANEIVRERVAKYEIQCDLKMGYCDVALKPRHMKEYAEWKTEEEQLGNPHQLRLLNREELKEYVNSDAYCGGLYNPGNGHLHPLNLCIGEARAAEGLGARIFEQSRVVTIEDGARPRVRTDQGSVSAKQIVLAGNAYLGGLVPKLASRVLPSSSSVVATAPLSESLAQELMPGDVAVCDPRTALDYFRLSADRRMVFGGLSNYTGLEPKDLEGTLRRKMEKVFPALAGVDIDYGWSGQMGIGLNRMPQLGRLSDNVAYIQAYSGHGVSPTHMMARITAEMIDGSPQRFDIFANIKHRAFPGGKWFRRPALAVGMSYFKIRDEL
ncbi:MAG: FAD-binding oxidoreductase [Halioglobus sp.]